MVKPALLTAGSVAAVLVSGLLIAPAAYAADPTDLLIGGSTTSSDFQAGPCNVEVPDEPGATLSLSAADADACLMTATGLTVTNTHGSIVIDGVSGSAGPLTISASADVTLHGSVAVSGHSVSMTAGDIFTSDPADSVEGTTVTLSSGLRTEINGVIGDVSTTTVTLAGQGMVTQAASGAVTAGTLDVTGGTAGRYVNLDSANNAVGALTADAANADLAVQNSQTLTLGNVDLDQGNFSVGTSNGTVTEASGVSIKAASVTIYAADGVAVGNISTRGACTIHANNGTVSAISNQTALTAGSLDVHSSGDATLGQNNAINYVSATVGTSDHPAAFTLNDARDLIVNSLSVPGGNVTLTAPDITRGSGNLVAATLNVTALSGADLRPSSGTNTVTTFSAHAPAGVQFSNTGSLSLGPVSSLMGVTLAAPSISQTGSLTADSLQLAVPGAVTLTDAGNAIGSLSGAAGDLTVTSTEPLTLAGADPLTVTGTASITAPQISSTQNVKASTVKVNAVGGSNTDGSVALDGLAPASSSGSLNVSGSAAGALAVSGAINQTSGLTSANSSVRVASSTALTVTAQNTASTEMVFDAHTSGITLAAGSTLTGTAVSLLAASREQVSVADSAVVQGGHPSFGPEYQNSATERWAVASAPASPGYSYRFFYADEGSDAITLGSGAASTGSYGQPVTFTATVTASGGSGSGATAPATPTGTVDFTTGTGANATMVCSGVDLNTNGKAACITSALQPAGSPYVVKASYQPYPSTDTTHIVTVYSNNSATTGYTVTKASSTTSLTTDQPGDTTTAGAPITLTATVSGTSPSGSVDFTFGNTVLCPGVAVATDGTAMCTTSALPASRDAVTATYSGDSRYNGSAAPRVVEVDAPPSITTLSLTDAAVGRPYSQLIAVTEGYPTPTDLVASGLPDGLTVDGSRDIVGVPTAAGHFSVHLTASNAAGLSTSATLTLAVASAATSLTLALGPNPAGYGQPTRAEATVAPAPDGGTVQFAVDGQDVGQPVAVREGVAPTALPGDLGAGSHQVTATYGGTSAYTASSVTAQLTIDKAATTTTVRSSGRALTALVVTDAGTPQGAVSFAVGDRSVGAASLNPTGTATLASTATIRGLLSAGPATVTATYAGSATFAASSDEVDITAPTITATIDSTVPRSAYGWYRSEVEVHYACAAGSAPVSCGPTVQLGASGHRVLTRVVTAEDGGNATLVTRIEIDRNPPSVAVSGARNGAVYSSPPQPTCIASDSLSGIYRCDVATYRHGHAVEVVAVAFDRAGNYTRRTGTYYLR